MTSLRRGPGRIVTGIIASYLVLSMSACVGSGAADTEGRVESVAGGDVVEVSTTVVTPSGDDLVFPLPKNLAHLNRVLPPVMTRFGANAMSSTRIFGYATVAWYDTASPVSTTPFIATAAAGQGDEQGMLAAGAVIAALLGNPMVAELVEDWEGELTPESSAVVEAVIEFANADGFDATAGEAAPVFDGEFGWKPGGTRHSAPEGYEPGYGKVRTVRLDVDACPVPGASIASFAAEREVLGELDLDIEAATIVRPERYSLLLSVYLDSNLPEERRADLPVISQVGNIMLHDALIATWRANWENGIASPLDLVVDGNPLLLSSHPSYPSWTEVAISSLETYTSGVLGENVTFDEIMASVRELQSTNTGYLQQLADLTAAVEINRSKEHHWKADGEAGRALGACIAGEALEDLEELGR